MRRVHKEGIQSKPYLQNRGILNRQGLLKERGLDGASRVCCASYLDAH